MNRKTIAISLVMLATLAAVLSVVTMTALADTNSTSTSTSASTASVSQTTPNMDISQFSGMQMMDQGSQGFMGGPGGRGQGMQQMQNAMGGMGNIEVSSEYNATVNAILENDTDVATLISQGYSVATIHPIIHSTISGDGTITTAASTAIVTLQNGTSGYSVVKVDIANAKVTYIETITRTVIDKSSS
jgi:hypothetical protein